MATQVNRTISLANKTQIRVEQRKDGSVGISVLRDGKLLGFLIVPAAEEE